ncbi:ankyrin repeat-containing domain protein [Clohesyomyces aquaticus]|uniref:Ankyrin repeat-containing domain protein n=1 Tax=Clohesyomyces aquaticus TaxID=1231657 RepID=A0A1Y2A174_9PLEO|nr:ankyrin repeat-containing domain protein [Clohesyomyces aquaticus]
MEVVGTVASIVTLAALAKELWALSVNLLHSYHDAPQELLRVSNQTSLILLELECIRRSQKEGCISSLLTNEEAWIFQQSLIAAKTSLAAIYRSCERYASNKKRATGRIAWTLFDRKAADEHLVHLQRTETSLGVVLQVINIRAMTKARDHDARQNEAIIQQLKAYHDEVRQGHYSLAETGNKRDDSTTFSTDSLVAFRFMKSTSMPECWRSILNSELLFVKSANEFQNAYEIYTRFPFFWFWGQKAFVLSASLRRMRTLWPNFQVLNASVSFCNIIPVESEIVKACRAGDIIAVRDLFREHKASPNDVSVDDRSLVWYATGSGSSELVSFLLNAGAPVRSCVLHAAAFFRQPQIARLLLHHGADVEVIGEDGFTSAFFLYGYSAQEKVPQAEFLEILACNSFSNFNGQDNEGWSVLHRIATFGTAEDVKTLVRMRASIHSRTHNLHWTPIFCAVCFSNMETLRELWEIYDDIGLKDIVDLRGWNLLHVAAGAGNFETIPYLLKQGVSLKAASKATSRSVPPALRNKSVTPSDVARNCGESAYKKWTESVRAAGEDVEVSPEDIDWTNESVDGVFGGCDCCKEWSFHS